MRIGEFANKAGVTEQTVRYYERLGMLTPSRRTSKSFRSFSSEALERLKLIKGLQALNMPLEEIVSLFQTWENSPSGNEAQRRLSSILEKKINLLDTRLEQHNELRDLLHRAVEQSLRCKKCTKKPSKEVCAHCSRITPAEKPAPCLSAFF